MKPSLGRTVYLICHDIIVVDPVYMVGKDHFLIGKVGETGHCQTWNCEYDEYNKTWFTSFRKAKKAIMNSTVAKHYIRPVLVKRFNGYYALKEKTYGEKAKWTTVNT